MATNLVTTTTTTPNQISVYGHPSPVHSGVTTPAYNSPSDPRLNQPLPLHSRQWRPSVVPFYMPAALRPTERPSKSAPPTPPRSVPGSPDTLTGDTSQTIRRRSTMDSGKPGITKRAEDQWMKREHLGEVTGLPTRDHWKADSASSSCDSPTCRSSFGLFLRRHHCRHCGHLFCSSHTPYLVPLDQEARFHPAGIPSRACDLCWSAFQRWQESRSSRLCMIQHSLDSQENGDTNPNDSERSDDSQDDSLKPALASTLNQSTDIAASVPRGWNWSTF